ncbi:MAG TPA: tetratricopeptide repeat protein [Verrucomicrobiae bacterium]|nr:tetratricopeptide repeat protein [Verrucomicrobiae bacterium]
MRSSRPRRPGRALAVVLALAGLPPLRALADPSPADREIAAAEQRIGVAASAADGYVALASAFMLKARESGDPGYYARAQAAVARALSLAPDHYEALRVVPWVRLGLHDFRGALAAAERTRMMQPDDWWNYGTLADAYAELGDYPHAVAAAQRMVDLRPGLPSYTRAAYLRALYGDRAGAIAIAKLAVAAASPRDPESRAWALVHLGHEHFAAGDLAAAARAYSAALEVFPDYYIALGGLARVRAAEGRLRDAIDLYRRAVARVPAPDLVASLGDVYEAAGDADQAERQYALVEYLGKVAEAVGTTYGRQLALFYADHDRRPEEALRLARLEAAGRGDIYTDDTLAWACYENGRLAEAARAAHRALRLGTEDAMLHYHAGTIAAALGHERIAARHLRRALRLNPHFDLRQAPRARATLAALEGRVLAAREGAR